MYLEAFMQSFISELTVVVEILRCQFRRFGDLGVARFGDVAHLVIKYVIASPTQPSFGTTPKTPSSVNRSYDSE